MVFTLTFNPDKVDSFDYSETTKKLSKWLNNMRRTCPSMKYVVVPELHKSGRWHFHGLFSNVENMVFVDSEKRDKKGRVIYNVGKYRLGFSTATKIDDVAKSITYVTKYVTKELCEVTYGKKDIGVRVMWIYLMFMSCLLMIKHYLGNYVNKKKYIKMK